MTEQILPSSGKRDYRLDFLRGIAVLVMIVDHVAGPSPLHLLTGGNSFFVSAAEGFVFISGFLVGIVYGGKVRRRGWPVAARQALGRAFTLYAVSVWLAVAFVLLSATLGLEWAPDAEKVTIGRFLLEIMTFQRAYFLVDVMQLYTLLLVVTPLALWLLHRGHWRWLLALSAGTWLAFQITGGQFHLPWPIQENPVFAFASWQLLFFGAMLLGYEREHIQRVWRSVTQPVRIHLPGGWLPLLTVLVGIMIWLHATNGSVLRDLSLVSDPATAFDAWFDKTRLPPLRLLASAVAFAFAWALVDRFWGKLVRVSGWLLFPIGTRALYAYVTHVLIVALLGALLLTPSETELMRPIAWPILALNAAGQIAALLAVWIIVRSNTPRKMVAWLGRPPVRIVRPGTDTPAIRRWQVAPSFGALAVLTVGSMMALATPWPAGPSFPDGQPLEVARASRPHIEPTAIARRGVAGVRTDSGSGSLASPDTRSVLLDRTFHSETLGREIPYGIYLPPDYQVDVTRRYPVLYLLHGAPTNYTEWAQLGLPDVADSMIANRQIQPFIVVFVEGEGSYFVNHQDGPAWGDYVAYDVVRHIDETERTVPDPASRAIGGLSMGGHGALQLGFNYPDVFGVVGAHGPALWAAGELPNPFGSPEYSTHYDPRELARSTGRPPLATWLDLPSEDPWLDRGNELCQTFEDHGWPLRYEVYQGEHNSDYWHIHIPDYLTFYSESLQDGSVIASGAGVNAGVRGEIQ